MAEKLKNFGDRLYKTRTGKGISRDFLAQKLGFTTQSQLSKYELGKAFPGFDGLQVIATALDVDLHWLVTGKAAPDTATLAVALKTPAEQLLAQINQRVRELTNDMVTMDLSRIFKGEKTQDKIRKTQQKIDELKAQYESLGRILASSFEIKVKMGKDKKK